MGSTASSLAIHFDIHNHGTATFRAGSCVRGYVEIKTGNRAIRHGKLALRAYRSSVGFSVEGMLWSGEMTLQPHSLYKITFEMEVPNWLPTSVGPRQQYHLEATFQSLKYARTFHVYNASEGLHQKMTARDGSIRKTGVVRQELEPGMKRGAGMASTSAKCDSYTLPSVTLGPHRGEAVY